MNRSHFIRFIVPFVAILTAFAADVDVDQALGDTTQHDHDDGPSFQVTDHSTTDIYNITVKVREGYSRYVTVNCTESPLDAFQRALGLPPDYTHRFIDRLKLEAVSTLVKLNTRSLLTKDKTVQAIESTPESSELLGGCGSNDSHCSIDATTTGGRQLKEGSSNKSEDQDQKKTNGLAKFLESVLINSIVDGIEAANSTNEIPRQKRRLSLIDELFEQFMTPSHGLETIPTVPDLTADLRLNQFLNSHFVDELVSSLIGKVVMSGTVTVHMDTPARNLGHALCTGATESHKIDGIPSSRYTCSILSLIASIEVCGGRVQELQCDPEPSVPLETCDRATGDQSYIPLTYLNNTELTPQEGNTDYWLFRSIRILSNYAHYQVPCNLPMNPNELLPGWTPKMHVWVGGLNSSDETPANQTSLPLAIMSESTQEKCHFLVTIRGSISEFDWLIDLSDKFHIMFEGSEILKVHGGFYSVAAPLNILLMTYLQNKHHECLTLCSNADSDCPLTFTLTGHSMGGGVAHVLALLMTNYMPKSGVRLTAFGSPHSLDSRSSYTLNQRALVRNWEAEFDPIPYLPCTTAEGTTMVCEWAQSEDLGGNLNNGFMMSGFGAVNQTRRTEDIDAHYADNPNIRLVEASALGLLNPKYREMSFGEIKYDLVTRQMDLSRMKRPAAIQFDEYHTCSYGCFLSTEYCFQSQAWLCDC